MYKVKYSFLQLLINKMSTVIETTWQ